MTGDMTNGGGDVNKRLIKADATKDFFVKMITRDISLGDCIFDLLDNAIDGARRFAQNDAAQPFAGRLIELSFDGNRFEISDNCGGILLSDAIDYAFYFGRRKGSHADVKGGIGLYGIGMKRAIFKIGRYCEVSSHAEDAAFKVTVDVETWEEANDWDFQYDEIPRTDHRGTRIHVRKLNDGAAAAFVDPGFKNLLIRDIARDYAFFIRKGLAIKVLSDAVPSYSYRLLEAEHLAPLVEEYNDDGVHVRILAGIVDRLPDDVPDDLRPEMVDTYGWFVVCNDRVVVAADKTERTVWGDDGFQVWHGQYNGFGGFVFFQAEDQRLLPWTTTKRELDAASPLYRRAIARMKTVTKTFIEYTNRRKLDLDAAHDAKTATRRVDIADLRQGQPLRLPQIAALAVAPDQVNISYKRLRREVNEIRTHLGDPTMSAKDVGIHTFDYFRKLELGK